MAEISHSFGTGSASDALYYQNRDNERESYNRVGNKIGSRELDQMSDRASQEGQMYRHYAIQNWSDPAMSDKDRREAVREWSNEMFDNETQVAWSYANDEEGNRNHIHLTAVGSKDDLAVYPNEFENYTERAEELASEKFGEQELEEQGLREPSWKAYENDEGIENNIGISGLELIQEEQELSENLELEQNRGMELG